MTPDVSGEGGWHIIHLTTNLCNSHVCNEKFQIASLHDANTFNDLPTQGTLDDHATLQDYIRPS